MHPDLQKIVATGDEQKNPAETVRFTADDIVRAIEAVEKTGLTIYSVEVAANGSIKVNTTSPFKRRAAPKAETSADDEIQPGKKQASG